MGTGTYGDLADVLVGHKHTLTVSTTACYTGVVLHKETNMVHRVNEYRKRRLLSMKEYIEQLEKENRRLAWECQQYKDNHYKLTEEVKTLRRRLGI